MADERSEDGAGCLNAAIGLFVGFPLLIMGVSLVVAVVAWLIAGLVYALKLALAAISIFAGIIISIFTVALLVDATDPVRRSIAQRRAVRRRLAQCPIPSLREFTGQPESELGRFLSSILAEAYQRQFGCAPDRTSFEGDEAGFLQFRRERLSQAVLARAYRPVVQDLFLRVHGLWCRGELPDKVSAFLNGQAEAETGRHPLAVTGRVIHFFTRSRWGLPASAVIRPRTAAEFRCNPDLFVELLWRHFPPHPEAVAQLLPAPADASTVGEKEQDNAESGPVAQEEEPRAASAAKAPTPPWWEDSFTQAQTLLGRAKGCAERTDAEGLLREALKTIDHALTDPRRDEGRCFALRAEILTRLSRCEQFAGAFSEAMRTDEAGGKAPAWYVDSMASSLMGQKAHEREAFRLYFGATV